MWDLSLSGLLNTFTQPETNRFVNAGFDDNLLRIFHNSP